MASKSEEQEYIDSNIVELSDRNFQIIKRTFEVHLDSFQDIIKDLSVMCKGKDMEDYLEDARGDGQLTLKSSKDMNNPFCLQLELCKRGTIHIQCSISFKDTIVFYQNIYVLDKPFEFENLKRSYEFCKCGKLCFLSRKQSKLCYIKEYVNEENCSICFENNYRWYTLKCGHKFHLHCLKKVEPLSSTTRKCPLCRYECDFSIIIKIK